MDPRFRDHADVFFDHTVKIKRDDDVLLEIPLETHQNLGIEMTIHIKRDSPAF